jgi:PncC family amidohydrolase
VSDELRALAETIAARLLQRGETLAVAETAAGGLISAALLAVAGASRWYLGGVVSYAPVAKERWLGLTAESLAGHGAVSLEGVCQMAEAARAALNSTWGLAEAGIAGPQTGRRSSKPAGLAWIAAVGPAPLSRELLTGLDDRGRNQRAFAMAALRLLGDALEAAQLH